MAFLSGPEGAAQVLADHGGLIVLDDGTVELFGPLSVRTQKPEAVAA